MTDRVIDLVGARDHVVHPAREVHDAQAVLEALVGGAGIDLVRERQLMDVPQPLKRWRVDDPPFVVIERDESVNRVSDLVHPRTMSSS